MDKLLWLLAVLCSLIGWNSAHSEQRAFGIELCSDVFAYQGEVYFCGYHRRLGRELFRSNGTTDGTYVVADIDAGPGSSDPINFFELKGYLYFFAETNITGRQLWRTDGSDQGTKRISDPTQNPIGFFSTKATLFNDGNLVYIEQRFHNTETIYYWRTDGSSEGTDLLYAKLEGNITLLNFFNGHMYLIRFIDIDGQSVKALQRISDSSLEPDTVKLLDDVCLPSRGKFTATIAPGSHVPINGKLLFSINCGEEESVVFVTDGTETGTRVVLEGNYLYLGQLDDQRYYYNSEANKIQSTNGTSTNNLGYCGVNASCIGGREIIARDDNAKLFFTLNVKRPEDLEYADRVYSTNGTADGTFEITKGSPRSPVSALGTRALLDVFESGLTQLWTTDGTVGGTRTLEFEGSGFSSNGQIFALDNQFIFFEKRTFDSTLNLWQSNGLDSNRISRFSAQLDRASKATIEADRLYFGLADYLWHTDGTEEGTYRVTYLDQVAIPSKTEFDGSQLIPSLELLLDDDEN